MRHSLLPSLLPLILATLMSLGIGLTAPSNLFAQDSDGESAATEKPDGGDAKADEKSKPDQEPPKTVELDGVFEATQVAPISIDLLEWKELIVGEAATHGQEVSRGDLVLRLDSENLERAIRDLELEIESDQLDLEVAEVKRELSQRTTELALEDAASAAQIAQEDLQEYEKNGRDRRIKSIEWSVKSARDRLEYQAEELKQLERMYEADDLTEETEEIILKRTRDAVESAKYSLELSLQSQQTEHQYSIPRQTKAMHVAAERAQMALKEAKESLPRSKRQAEIKLEQQRIALEAKHLRRDQLHEDLERLEIVAPQSGVVYYGEAKRGKWSDSTTIAATLSPGASVKADTVLMTVVQPSVLVVRLSVPEASLRHFAVGTAVTVAPVAYPDITLKGSVQEVSTIPIADGQFDAKISVNVKATDASIVPGMTAKVKVPLEKK